MKALTSPGLTELITKVKAWCRTNFLNKTDVEQASTLSIDSSPTASSTNLVSSGGVYAAIATSAAGVQTNLNAVTAKISDVASSTNKLVSASEMGDAIEAVEAKQLYATNAQGSFATKAALTSASVFYNADGTQATPTKNDVAYVLADESHSNKSAKYVIANDPTSSSDVTWGFVITFSDNSFSQAQMNAINSGATSGKIGDYDEHIADTDIHVTAAQKTAWSGKQSAPIYIKVVLRMPEWGNDRQTVSVTGVTASNIVQISAYSKSDADAWSGGGLWCTAQGAGMLTFTCETPPTADIALNVLIWN